MADSELDVALVALVISIIALAITTLQLAAQIFSTAEGTRKCSLSVLGSWCNHPMTRTHWHFRRAEGRFETFFVIPEIYLGSRKASKIRPQLHTLRLIRFLIAIRNFGQGRSLLRALLTTTPMIKLKSVLGEDADLDEVLFESAFIKPRRTWRVGFHFSLSFDLRYRKPGH